MSPIALLVVACFLGYFILSNPPLKKGAEGIIAAFLAVIWSPLILGHWIGTQLGWDNKKDENKTVLLGLAIYVLVFVLFGCMIVATNS